MSQAALITRLNELPRIQSLLQELLEMVNQEEVNFGALAKKISMDQVLSARLLRMANSAHFGGTKSIATINDALIRVGTGPVRTLVVGPTPSRFRSSRPNWRQKLEWTSMKPLPLESCTTLAN